MPARSLKDLAREACIRNIRDIVDVGDYPYALLRPILLKIQNPHQLKRLEVVSPQICENETEANDAEIWMNFIKCDIPQWEKKFASREKPRLGWDLYQQLRLEDKMQIERDSEELKAKLKCIKDEKAKHTSRLLDPSEVPRTAGQKRKAAAATSRNQSTSTLTFGSGSRTKTTTGASILKKAAREAKEMHLFGARALLSTPSNQLKSKTSRVQSAPRGITQAYQSKAQPVLAQPNGILSQAELERRKQARVAKASSSLPPPIQEPRSHSPRSSSSAGVKRESTGSPKYVGTTQPSDSVENSDLPRRPIKVARTKTSFFTSLSNRGKSAQIIPPKPRIKTVSSPSRKEPPTSLDAPLSPTASLFSPPPSPSLSASPLPSSASSNGSREASSRGRTPHLSPGGPRPRQSVSPVKKIRRAQQTDPMLRRPPNAAKRRIGA